MGLTVAAGASIAEIFASQVKQADSTMAAGDMGFDPLNLYPADAAAQEQYQLAELKHGRVAMLAIALIVLEEAVSGTSFLKETPLLWNEIGRLGTENTLQAAVDLQSDLVKDATS